jgi:hypothetical protein
MAGIAGALALLLALSGCVTTAGGTTGELARSAQDAAADTGSARLALSLFAKGRSTVGVSGTALSDALSNLTDAQASVASTSISTRAERTLRAKTLAELKLAVTAVQDAQDVVSDIPGAPGATRVGAALKSVTTALDELGKAS